MEDFEADIAIRHDYPYPTLALGLPEGTESVRVRRLPGGPPVHVVGFPVSVRRLVLVGPVIVDNLWLCPYLESLRGEGAIVRSLLPASLRSLHLVACHLCVEGLSGCPYLEHLHMESMGALLDLVPRELWAGWETTLQSFNDLRSGPCPDLGAPHQ